MSLFIHVPRTGLPCVTDAERASRAMAGHWPLGRVTHALSDFADAALSATISHLLRGAAESGDLVLADEHFPEDGCGYVALGMGKHGARELNYSSDIDLIILYDPVK